jgi:hypothetical protein
MCCAAVGLTPILAVGCSRESCSTWRSATTTITPATTLRSGTLELTPAYDLCPQIRSGETSAQAMAFNRDGTRESSFAACLRAAPVYGLTPSQAREVIDGQIDVIERCWAEVADLARLSMAQRNLLWRRQILNPYAGYGYRLRN